MLFVLGGLGNMGRRTVQQTINLETGHITWIEYSEGAQLHRDVSIGPAVLSFDENTGEMRHREFRVHGELHNPNGPASEFWRDGLLEQTGYFIDGHLHRDDGPALVRYRGGTTDVSYEGWYQHGVRHRDPREGPAEIEYDSNGTFRETYFVGGKRVRRPPRPAPSRARKLHRPEPT
jgi:hypothetical protein